MLQVRHDPEFTVESERCGSRPNFTSLQIGLDRVVHLNHKIDITQPTLHRVGRLPYRYRLRGGVNPAPRTEINTRDRLRVAVQLLIRSHSVYSGNSTVSTAQQSSTSTKTITGADILIGALVRNGGDTIFAYPGGASMPLHQALTRRKDQIRTILPRHEQGGGFAAQGYSRTTDNVGLCMATSGPGATNLVTSIADAKMDSVPLIAITGQVPQAVIGTDAFQETPIVEICRAPLSLQQ